MGLFRKSDELFELMGKRGGDPDQSGGGSPGGSTSQARSRGFTRPFETTTGFGRSSLFGRSAGMSRNDVLTVDGDALVVVDDGFSLGSEGGEPSKGIAIRPDTLIVGALLATGLFVTAFLLGRTSSTDAPVATVQVAAGEDTDADADAPAEEAAQPAGEPIQAAAPQQIAAPAQAPSTQAPSAPQGATTLAASAPAPQGRRKLIVASTTPESARKLAEWFEKNPLSPIFGRRDLRAEASSRGQVSIRGFQEDEPQVLKRVRATNDPLGGSGSFGDAYFKSDKR